MWIALTCHDLFIMNQFIIMPKRNNYDACYMNSAIYTGLFGDSSQRINLKIVFFFKKKVGALPDHIRRRSMRFNTK